MKFSIFKVLQYFMQFILFLKEEMHLKIFVILNIRQERSIFIYFLLRLHVKKVGNIISKA